MFDHNSHIIMSTHRLLFTMLALVMALACSQGADAASAPLQVYYSLDYALNVAGGTIHFTSVGTYPWTANEEDGRVYGRSGNAGTPSSASVLSAQVVVARDAVLTFDFKAWGEGDGPLYDKCVFTIDGATRFNYGAPERLGNIRSGNSRRQPHVDMELQQGCQHGPRRRLFCCGQRLHHGDQ